MAEEKNPQPTFLSGLGNFYFNIKYDDSMVPITSASSENAASRICRYEKPTAADCKSALKWSNLFCLRIANPQERLTDHNA